MERPEAPRSIGQLRKLPMNQLTEEERILVYGKGSENVMRYRQVERDGKKLIVHREFRPGDAIPDGWEDSPAKFGVETEPQNQLVKDDDFEGVVTELPATATAAKAKK